LAKAARILVPSRSTADDLAEYFPEAAQKVYVTPLAPGIRWNPNAPSSNSSVDPYMLVVGTIEPRKNHDKILDAFESVSITPNWEHRLVVVGAQGWKSSHVVRRLSRIRNVRHVDKVTDEQLASYYADADFLISPSLYEGFGLQILEALEFGKPVITSNLSSMPEVAGDAGILVDPHSAQEIATAMRRLAADRELRFRLGTIALEQAARFSWQQTAIKTLQALEDAGCTA
jgi:glycosyltransferase involved in cell wall biosynthesis